MITKANAIDQIFGKNKKIDINKAFLLLDLFEKENAPNNYLEEIKRLQKENREQNAKYSIIVKQNHNLNERLAY